jgi:hypothetical protein
MTRHYNNFEFIGNISFSKDEKKVFETIQHDSGWQTKRLNVGVKATATNGVFLKADAMYNPTETNTIFTLGKDNAKLEIPFKDRNKQSSIDMVADFKKLTVDLETDLELKKERIKLKYQIIAIEKREDKTEDDLKKLEEYRKEYIEKSTNLHEFISEYDFVNFLHDSAELLKQHKIRVTGNLEMSLWNGKYYVSYVAKTVEFIDDEIENKLEATVDVYFDKNAIDDTLFKDNKKLIVNGYLVSYDNSVKADRFYPKKMMINASMLNFEDESQVGQYEFLKSYILTEKDTIQHMLWKVNVYRGAEVKEFTYENLTPAQKQMVDIGLAKIEDFRPRGGFLGDNIDEFRLFLPVLADDFKDGMVDSLMAEEEFIKLLAVQTEKPKKETVKNQPTKDTVLETSKPNNDVEQQMKKLFG